MSTDQAHHAGPGEIRADRRLTVQLLAAADLDSDAVSVFEDGDGPGLAERAVFVVKGRENIDFVRSLCERQQLLTAGKPITLERFHTADDVATAIVLAAYEWACDRTITDWNEADLMRAVIAHGGDWPGCAECDHDCGEPCAPATVDQQLRGIDWQLAQLVHEGKLAAPTSWQPPEGWRPRIARPRRRGHWIFDAQHLARQARAAGFVITISQAPMVPLAMGHHEDVVEVREVRS